jgi:transposase
MEATGQYWKPVWYVLEEQGFQLLLVNARHVKILLMGPRLVVHSL